MEEPGDMEMEEYYWGKGGCGPDYWWVCGYLTYRHSLTCHGVPDVAFDQGYREEWQSVGNAGSGGGGHSHPADPPIRPSFKVESGNSWTPF